MKRRERPNCPENEQAIRSIAAQGAVLLENRNQTLPLKGVGPVALYGMGAVHTIPGGGGSAGVIARHTINVCDAFTEAGFEVVSEKSLEELRRYYDEHREKLVGYIEEADAGRMEGFIGDAFRPGDRLIPDAVFEEDAKKTDLAIYVFTRMIGEGYDRKKKAAELRQLDDHFKDSFVEMMKKGNGIFATGPNFFVQMEDYRNDSYDLTEVEISNITRMSKWFKRTIVLLNTGGPVDANLFHDLEELGAVVLLSYGGMEAGYSALDVVTGRITPSGKLTDTWAKKYEDNPASAFFASNGDGNAEREVYSEGIYVGYRYFDSFNVEPLYPFGYGLSYTSFGVAVKEVTADAKQAQVKVLVKNTGSSYSGREVVQVYFSAPEGELEHPYQELVAFGKTDEGKWVSAHAHEHGFIVRYLEGSEDVTGYMYEPWHVRYVGKALAKELYESGLPMETFLSGYKLEVYDYLIHQATNEVLP